MSDDDRLPTLEEFKNTILVARRSCRAAFRIAETDGNKRAARAWWAMLRKYDRLAVKYEIEEPSSPVPEPTLDAWRQLLNMPARP